MVGEIPKGRLEVLLPGYLAHVAILSQDLFAGQVSVRMAAHAPATAEPLLRFGCGRDQSVSWKRRSAVGFTPAIDFERGPG